MFFPVIANATERVSNTSEGLLVIYKKSGWIQVTGSDTNNWKTSTGKRIFNFVPGFQAAPLQISLDKHGKGLIQTEVPNAL